jgi:hypothetical protein
MKADQRASFNREMRVEKLQSPNPKLQRNFNVQTFNPILGMLEFGC